MADLVITLMMMCSSSYCASSILSLTGVMSSKPVECTGDDEYGAFAIKDGECVFVSCNPGYELNSEGKCVPVRPPGVVAEAIVNLEAGEEGIVAEEIVNLEAGEDGIIRRVISLDERRRHGYIHRRFPEHWGPKPSIQSANIQQLPGGYGTGSSTLAGWIQRNMDLDVAEGRTSVTTDPVRPGTEVGRIPPCREGEELRARLCYPTNTV